MKYSIRPSYLDIEREGQPWTAFHILGDLAYFASLLGSIIGTIFWILWPIFRAARHQDPRWSFALLCLLAHIIVSATVFGISVFSMRYMFKRFDVEEY